ncbi:MAG: hypothetical protein IJE25_06025 [Clostridia bacterium]|nr:hypothetical protein [Clostridia bacterium]
MKAIKRLFLILLALVAMMLTACGNESTDTSGDTVIGDGGHSHSYGERQLQSPENTPCEERIYFQVCGECKEVKWLQGTEKDHKWSTETVAPTCGGEGYDLYTCSSCGKEKKATMFPTIFSIIPGR